MAHQHYVTFRNNTSVTISFRREYKSVDEIKFRLDPGKSRVEELIETQTNEKYSLLDPTGRNTQLSVDADELHDYTEVIVEEVGGEYSLNKVPRTNTSSSNQTKRSTWSLFSKCKDKTLPK